MDTSSFSSMHNRKTTGVVHMKGGIMRKVAIITTFMLTVIAVVGLAYVSGAEVLNWNQQQLDNFNEGTLNHNTLLCDFYYDDFCGSDVCKYGNYIFTQYSCLDIERVPNGDGTFNYVWYNSSISYAIVPYSDLIDYYIVNGEDATETYYWNNVTVQVYDHISDIQNKVSSWKTPDETFWENWQGGIF